MLEQQLKHAAVGIMSESVQITRLDEYFKAAIPLFVMAQIRVD